MSTKFEVPSNDEQSNHADRDSVSLKLFNCAFDGPSASSSSDNLAPASGPASQQRIVDNSKSPNPSDTTSSATNNVVTPLRNLPQSSSADRRSVAECILPKITLEGVVSPLVRSEASATPQQATNQVELLRSLTHGGPSALRDNFKPPVPSDRSGLLPASAREQQIFVKPPVPSDRSGLLPASAREQQVFVKPPVPRVPIDLPTRTREQQQAPKLPKVIDLPRASEQQEIGSTPSLIKSFDPPRATELQQEVGTGLLAESKTKFKFPKPDRPLPKMDGLAEMMAPAIPKYVDALERSDLAAIDKLSESILDTLMFGVVWGENAMNDLIAKMNKKLEGTGIELKTDGNAFVEFEEGPGGEKVFKGEYLRFEVSKDGKRVGSMKLNVSGFSKR